jgi:branched-chain amino acid transport system substrate-binding protein
MSHPKRTALFPASWLSCAAAVLGLGLAACDEKGSPAGPGADEDWSFLLATDVSGPGRSYGYASQQAVLMAFLDRLDQEPQTAIAKPGWIVDTENDADRTAALIAQTEWVNDLHFVVGPSNSQVAAELAHSWDDPNLPLEVPICLSPSSVAISLEQDDNVLRFAPSDRNQARAIAALLMDDGVDNLVVLRPEGSIWAFDLSEAVIAEMAGASQVGVHAYTVGTLNSVLAEAETEVAAGWTSEERTSGAVYLVCFGEGVDILEIASDYPTLSGLPWYGASAFANNAALLENANALANAETLGLTCPVFGVDLSGEAGNVHQRLEERLGRPPESYALVAFDVYGLLTEFVGAYVPPAETPVERGALERDAIDQLLDLAASRSGLTGSLELNEYGDRRYGDYHFWRVEGGGWNKVAEFNIDEGGGTLVRN